MEETASSYKQQGLLLKAEKLATGEPLFITPSVIIFSTLPFLAILVTFSHWGRIHIQGFLQGRAADLWLTLSSGSTSYLCALSPGEAIKRSCSFFTSTHFLLWKDKFTDSSPYPLVPWPSASLALHKVHKLYSLAFKPTCFRDPIFLFFPFSLICFWPGQG